MRDAPGRVGTYDRNLCVVFGACGGGGYHISQRMATARAQIKCLTIADDYDIMDDGRAEGERS